MGIKLFHLMRDIDIFISLSHLDGFSLKNVGICDDVTATVRRKGLQWTKSLIDASPHTHTRAMVAYIVIMIF